MLTIRVDQVLILQAAARARFHADAAAHLRQYFPERTAALSGATLHDVIVRTLATATQFGLTTQREHLLYLDLAATYGWEFHCDSAYRWMSVALSEPVNSSPSERLQYLIDLCLERQAREQRRRTLQEVPASTQGKA